MKAKSEADGTYRVRAVQRAMDVLDALHSANAERISLQILEN